MKETWKYGGELDRVSMRVCDSVCMNECADLALFHDPRPRTSPPTGDSDRAPHHTRREGTREAQQEHYLGAVVDEECVGGDLAGDPTCPNLPPSLSRISG